MNPEFDFESALRELHDLTLIQGRLTGAPGLLPDGSKEQKLLVKRIIEGAGEIAALQAKIKSEVERLRTTLHSAQSMACLVG